MCMSETEEKKHSCKSTESVVMITKCNRSNNSILKLEILHMDRQTQ